MHVRIPKIPVRPPGVLRLIQHLAESRFSDVFDSCPTPAKWKIQRDSIHVLEARADAQRARRTIVRILANELTTDSEPEDRLTQLLNVPPLRNQTRKVIELET